MSSLFSLSALIAFGTITSAQNSSQGLSSPQSTSASATPSCVQPRQPSDPSPSAISSVLTSAVPNACNISTQKIFNNGLLDTIYYQVDSLTFNISHSVYEVNQPAVSTSLCPDTYNSIISACVNVQSSGYWGGWITGDGTNYSISNFDYPGNGLLTSSSTVTSVSSSANASTGSVGGGSGGSNPAASQSSLQGGDVGSSISAPSISGPGQTVATGPPGSALYSASTEVPASSTAVLGSTGGQNSGSGSPSIASSTASQGDPGSTLPGSVSVGSASAGPSTTGSASATSIPTSSASTFLASTGSSSAGSAPAASTPPISASTGLYSIGSASLGSVFAGSTSAASIPTGSASTGPASIASVSTGSASAGSASTVSSSAGSASATSTPSSSASTSSISAGSTSASSGILTGAETRSGPSSAPSGSAPPGSSVTALADSVSTGTSGPVSTGVSGSGIGSSSGGSASSGTGNPSAGPTTSASIPVISPSGSGINEDYSLAPGIIATGNPTDLVIGGETLVPGGKPYSDASNLVSLETGGLVNVDGQTVQLGNPPAQATPTSQFGSLFASSSFSTSSQVNSGSSVGTAPGATVTSAPASGFGSNPSSSTSGMNVSLITSTLTVAPSSFSTVSTSNTLWTGNTWLTTEQNGQSTILPVIVNCPNCGGVHGGIILWNLPELPSVSFQFPGFPNLPPFHLPCIKIFGIAVSGDCSSPPEDDNPNDEDPDTTGSNPSGTATSDSPSATSSPNSVSASTTGSQSSSSSVSSGSCAPSATRTASDCSVQCGATSSNQACSTTCFSTVVGCDATGTTIYSSASASESGCWSLLPSGSGGSGVAKRAAVTSGSPDGGCNYACPATLPQIPTTGPLSVSLPTTDSADYEKRALGGRTFHVLEKRKSAVTIAAINGCNLATPAGQPVVTPAYPGGYEFWTSETNGVLPASYQTISRYYKTTPAGCIPTVTAVPANQLSPLQNSGDNNNENSVDHAYENGWLTSFMQSITNKGGSTLTCNELNAIFFTATCNFLAPVFGALASATNPDFIVMSQYLNGDAKGWILGSGYETPADLLPTYVVQSTWSWPDAYANIQYKIGTLGPMLVGCLMVQAPNLIDMIQRTNNRIYSIFEQIDQSLATDPSIPRYNFGFAQQYKDYMNSFATQWNGVPAYVTQLIDSVGQDLATSHRMKDVVESEWNPMYQVWSEYLTNYENTNSAAWKYSISLAFDTTNTKRDLQLLKRSACSLASGSPSSATSSQTSTSAVPSSSTKSPTTTGSQTGTSAAPSSSTNSPPTTTTTSAAFSCTSAANPEDPDYPCNCSDGFIYCANNGSCNWTSEPPGENCCLDCS